MRWNEDVERRRREYHKQRCAEDELYRRAYERQEEERRRLQKLIGQNMVLLADAMNAECQQRVNSVTENVEQPVRTHEEVMNDRVLMDSVVKYSAEWMAQSTGFGHGFAVAAMMFADGEKLRQRMKEIEEEKPYAEDIRKADAAFDKERIRLSGFMW